MKATLDGTEVRFTCDCCPESAVRLAQDSGGRWSAWCADHRPHRPPATALPVQYAVSLDVLLTLLARHVERRRG